MDNAFMKQNEVEESDFMLWSRASYLRPTRILKALFISPPSDSKSETLDRFFANE
jgi:hypothetical protein